MASLRGSSHYTISRNVADGIFAALTSAEARARLVETLEHAPLKGLTGLVKPDKATRDKLKRLPPPFTEFVAKLVVALVKIAAEQGAQIEEGVSDQRGKAAAQRIYTSAALSVGQHAGTWLGAGFTSEVIQNSSFSDWLGLCLLALDDLRRKEEAAKHALDQLALCLAGALLPGSTQTCGAEDSNFRAALHDLEVALNNLQFSCGWGLI